VESLIQGSRGLAGARTRAAGAALALVAALLSAACSGGSGVTLPSITATLGRPSSGTGQALPSVTRSSAEPSESRGSTSASQESTPERSTPERTTPEQSTPEQSNEQSQAPPSAVVSARESTANSSTTPVATSASTTTDGDSTGWPPWVLVALVLVAIGVVVAIVQHRSSRRKAERSSFETALSESLWFGRDLTPALLGESPDERRGAWRVARSRVVALEDRLARLAASESESSDSSNVQQLATAVVGLRRALDAESQPGGGPSDAAEALGGVKQAARQLDQLLSGYAPTPGPPG
jgi:hypothetical protein